ncbi:MAG: hypothetical protein [Microviridae sp.]|nr:MAG: hypothetical protein [Microviridae sp.]
MHAKGPERARKRKARSLPGDQTIAGIAAKLPQMRATATRQRANARQTREAPIAGQPLSAKRRHRQIAFTHAAMPHAGTASARSATTFTLRSLDRCLACRATSFA